MASNDPRGEGQNQGQRLPGDAPDIPERQPDALSSVQDRTTKMASALSKTAEETWDQAKHRITDTSSVVATEAEHAWGSMVSCMRQYPLAVFFTAIGVGFVMAH